MRLTLWIERHAPDLVTSSGVMEISLTWRAQISMRYAGFRLLLNFLAKKLFTESTPERRDNLEIFHLPSTATFIIITHPAPATKHGDPSVFVSNMPSLVPMLSNPAVLRDSPMAARSICLRVRERGASWEGQTPQIGHVWVRKGISSSHHCTRNAKEFLTESGVSRNNL